MRGWEDDKPGAADRIFAGVLLWGGMTLWVLLACALVWLALSILGMRPEI